MSTIFLCVFACPCNKTAGLGPESLRSPRIRALTRLYRRVRRVSNAAPRRPCNTIRGPGRTHLRRLLAAPNAAPAVRITRGPALGELLEVLGNKGLPGYGPRRVAAYADACVSV